MKPDTNKDLVPFHLNLMANRHLILWKQVRAQNMSKLEMVVNVTALQTAKKPASRWMPPRGHLCQERFRGPQNKVCHATAEALLSFAKLSILSAQEK